ERLHLGEKACFIQGMVELAAREREPANPMRVEPFASHAQQLRIERAHEQRARNGLRGREVRAARTRRDTHVELARRDRGGCKAGCNHQRETSSFARNRPEPSRAHRTQDKPDPGPGCASCATSRWFRLSPRLRTRAGCTTGYRA